MIRVKPIVCLCILSLVSWVSGCAVVPLDSSDLSKTKNLVFGYIQVKTVGPNPRNFPTKLRFISLINLDSGKSFRIDVHSSSDVFSYRLPLGNYSVNRVQFNEGPSMAESYLPITFQVSDVTTTFLGVWEFEVETPRTVRLMRMHLGEGDPEFTKKFSEIVVPDHRPIETQLPKPDTIETRVFSVAPNPKVKYFYR